MAKVRNFINGLLFLGLTFLGVNSILSENGLNKNQDLDLKKTSRFSRVETVNYGKGMKLELFYSNVHADSDNTPPITEVNHQPLNPNDTDDVLIVANAYDFESGIQRFEINIDGNNANPDSNFYEPYPDSIAATLPMSMFFPNGVEGTHEYFSKAINSVGGESSDPSAFIDGDKSFNPNNESKVPVKTFTVNSSIMKVPAGWAMVSLPRQANNSTVSGLFSSATTLAYYFNSEFGGYESGDSLEPGKGYWIKFANEETLPVVGDSIWNDYISLGQGWNLMAQKHNRRLSTSIENITSDPPGIVSSKFYYYDPELKSYVPTNVLKRSESYFVKATQPGTLTLNDSPSAQSVNLESRLDEMPPAPPGGKSASSQNSLNVRLSQQNGVLNFDYISKENSTVEIYDIIGRKVANLRKNESWNYGTSTSNGVYYFRVMEEGKPIYKGSLISMDGKILPGK